MYLTEFEGFLQTRSGEPAWLTPLRRAALSRFSELGFPNRHQEEWRFTVVTPIAETPFRRAEKVELTPEDLNVSPLGELPFPRLVFVNGKFAPELSQLSGLPDRVVVTNLGTALRDHATLLEPHLGRYAGFENHPFVALNTAYFEDGAFVYIPRNVVVETPLVLAFVTMPEAEPTVAHPRTLIVAEANSQAALIETYFGLTDSVYLTNAVTEIVAGENAVVGHVKVTQERDTAYHVQTMQVEVERGANVASHNFTFGGAIVRNDHNARFHGENAECTLNGLYLAKDGQLVDNHTSIDHALPHCDSHEIYKGILDGKGRGVFNGKIFVRKDAQKTDAKQTNQTLLLSKEATINTKPQLEIFADDVKCTHGATVGQLEAEPLFYLRSRGISEQEAQNILVRAFADDLLDRVKPEALHDAIQAALSAALPQSARYRVRMFEQRG
jgi:Fe-S cluster assembly protein SufD